MIRGLGADGESGLHNVLVIAATNKDVHDNEEFRGDFRRTMQPMTRALLSNTCCPGSGPPKRSSSLGVTGGMKWLDPKMEPRMKRIYPPPCTKNEREAEMRAAYRTFQEQLRAKEHNA
jgi:hypothetical protein